MELLYLDPLFGRMSSLGLTTVSNAKSSGFREVIRSESTASSSENLRVETEQVYGLFDRDRGIVGRRAAVGWPVTPCHAARDYRDVRAFRLRGHGQGPAA